MTKEDHLTHPLLLPRDAPVLRGVVIDPETIMNRLLWDDKYLCRLTYHPTKGIDGKVYDSYRLLTDMKDTIVFHIEEARNNLYHDRVSIDNALLLWKHLIYSQRRFSLWHLPEGSSEPQKKAFKLYNPMRLHAGIWEALFEPLWAYPLESAQGAQARGQILQCLRKLIFCHACHAFACDEKNNRSCSGSCGSYSACCRKGRSSACWNKSRGQWTVCKQHCPTSTDPALLAGLVLCLKRGLAANAANMDKVKKVLEDFFGSPLPEEDLKKEIDAEHWRVLLLACVILTDCIRGCIEPINAKALLQASFEPFRKQKDKLLNRIDIHSDMAQAFYAGWQFLKDASGNALENNTTKTRQFIRIELIEIGNDMTPGQRRDIEITNKFTVNYS